MDSDSGTRVGFVVVYRWRLHPGREEEFESAWERITRAFLAERGALGSRLHRAEDGTFVAYAQWPSRSSWEKSAKLGPIDQTASDTMRRAVVESLEPILLEPTRDLLVHSD